MGALDRPMRTVAKTLSDKLGKQGTIEYVATGGYSPSTGKAAQSTTKAITAGALSSYREHEIDGTTVKRGDLKWKVPAKDLPRPHANDVVDFGETTPSGIRIRYTILAVDAVHSGDQPALYTLQLRR